LAGGGEAAGDRQAHLAGGRLRQEFRQAKYAYDTQRPGLLYGAVLGCPHAHARVTSIDASAAQKSKGVTAVELLAKPGDEIQWAGYEVAAVAAVSEDLARDALAQDQGRLRGAAARGGRAGPC